MMQAKICLDASKGFGMITATSEKTEDRKTELRAVMRPALQSYLTENHMRIGSVLTGKHDLQEKRKAELLDAMVAGFDEGAPVDIWCRVVFEYCREITKTWPDSGLMILAIHKYKMARIRQQNYSLNAEFDTHFLRLRTGQPMGEHLLWNEFAVEITLRRRDFIDNLESARMGWFIGIMQAYGKARAMKELNAKRLRFDLLLMNDGNDSRVVHDVEGLRAAVETAQQVMGA